MKKPYRPPRLRRYGDLRSLTGGNNKTRKEVAIPPKTKAAPGTS